jgi:hypothetical protein
MFKALLLLSICWISYASNVDNNLTNIGVYLNKIASCNYNSLTGNLLCASQEFETLIQYHNVKHVKMCDYHYCVRFLDEQNVISCSGYLLKLIGGNMDTFLNPLTPNEQNIDFVGDKANVKKIGKAFMGYNILIDSFIQNIQTTFEKNIESIECEQPHTTCIQFEGQNDKVCFGSEGYKFHDSLSSLMFGLLIPGIISFSLYIFNYLLCWKNVSHNYFIIFIVIPTIVILISFLILFQAEKFIVKTHVFMLGSVFGIILGHLLSQLINSCRKKKKLVRYNEEENVALKSEKQTFSISEDDDDTDEESKEKNKDDNMVTIELNNLN